MQRVCELSQRTRIRAFRARGGVLIVAEGELPSPGFQVDITQNPRRIAPPQFDLLRCPLSGVFPAVITPFRYSETVFFPDEAQVVTVHHADGADEVEIEAPPEELASYVQATGGEPGVAAAAADGDEATGFSRNLSFDQAFSDALAKLPPLEVPGADVMVQVEVLEIGGLFGGIAGFRDLFVRVRRTHD